MTSGALRCDHCGVRLDAIPREVLVAIAALALLFVVVSAARSWAKRVRLRFRLERALEGEREAVGILEDHGYAIEGAQVTTTYAIEVDGAPVAITLRADYVVTRGRERFIAEVKTGQVAPRVQAPATRRQLLEYHVAFGASGVLLVDAETRSVHRIAFPAPPGASRSRPFIWALALTAVALAGFAAAR
ncbi:MAG: hypothetical protein BGO98_29095 [Myxococcales bacterium 68-20]|nr:MAG: hypothetical protein BGO98_29095 [Myxococcales bacterium 68-20]